MAHLIARVAVEKALYHFDKLYSYLVPSKFLSRAQVGARVVVPFGKGNRKSVGIIFALDNESDVEKIKPIASFPDSEPIADRRVCDMAVWLKENTFCTLFDAVKAQLPAGVNIRMIAEYCLARQPDDAEREGFTADERTVVRCLSNCEAPVSRERLSEILGVDSETVVAPLVARGIVYRSDEAVRNIGDASVKVVTLTDDEAALEEYFSVRRSPQQTRTVDFLKEVRTASVREALYFSGVTLGVIKTLEKHGILTVYDEETYRRPKRSSSDAKQDVELTDEQKKVCEGLYSLYLEDKPAAALLYGVTGSGKTRVYIELIRRALDRGDNCIVMVPEIALTPQTASLFFSIFGDKVAIIHSGLSMGERFDEWKRIRRGEAKIALGTRSAVFAPFSKVGLIIIDEEQESTYKSESTPRYHARDAAKFIAAKDKALLLLGSATPSVETFYFAQNGRYSFFNLPTRYSSAGLPHVTVCDVAENDKSGVIGRTLSCEIQKNIDEGEKTILLHNRRGYNTFVACESCRTVYTCPNCSVSMTYHSANRRLMCHYCGYSSSTDIVCRVCGGTRMRFSGFGTQRVVDEIASKFPQAKVLRMDADTTAQKNGHDKILSEFANGGYDILLGTQMVAKGLDFPEVTLVGVISADQTLYTDDFRAFERAFTLLTQVAGRSGRGEKQGRALIQTFTPENPIFEEAAKQDYDAFFAEEIERRRILTYPPFCDMCEITFSGMQESRVKDAAKDFFESLKAHCVDEYSEMPLKVLNPSPATVHKLGSRYYYRLIMKCRADRLFKSFISKLLIGFAFDKAHKNVAASADINPSVLL